MSADPPPPVTPNLVETLERVEQLLTCRICLNCYTDPRVLPCLHVFCRRCVRPEDKGAPERGSTPFCCPVCQLVTDTATVVLLPAHHIQHLFDVRDVLLRAETLHDCRCEKCLQERASSFCRDCGQYICGECIQTHKLWRELQSHEIVSVPKVIEEAVQMLPPKRRVMRCSKHSKDLELYCKSCAELICHNCTVQQHKSHNYHIASDVFPSHEEAISVNAKLLKNTLALVKQALEEFDACSARIATQRDSIQRNIDDTIGKLHEELELRRKEFELQLNQISSEKTKLLALQRSQVEALQSQLSDALAFTERHITTGSECEILEVSKHVARRSAELVNSYDASILIPNQTANMIFKPQRLEDACIPYRGVCIALICPSKCTVSSSQPMDIAFTNTQSTIVVHLKDENGMDYFNPLKHITATLMSGSDITQCQVERHSNGTYAVSYKPRFPKVSTLCVQINGTHVQGSPFKVLVKRSRSDIVMNPKALKGLKRPCGVACMHLSDEMVIVERGLSKVSVFGMSLNVVRKFGSFGSAPGEFNDPDGVTVDSSDNILVVDSGNHRIQKFTAKGVFITAVGSKGVGPLQFNLPTSVKIHPQTGNVYVCDQYNHRIQIMKEDFSFVGSFGRIGTQDGDLFLPTDLAFDSTGNVFVSVTENNCIQVYDHTGHFLRKFSDFFPSPSYLCIIDGTLYLSDSTEYLSVFTTEGVFIGFIGKEAGPNMPHFNQVHGIAVDRNGKILAVDYAMGTIHVF